MLKSLIRRQDLLLMLALWFKYQPVAKVLEPPPFQLSLKLDWLRLIPVAKSVFHFTRTESAVGLDSANSYEV